MPIFSGRYIQFERRRGKGKKCWKPSAAREISIAKLPRARAKSRAHTLFPLVSARLPPSPPIFFCRTPIYVDPLMNQYFEIPTQSQSPPRACECFPVLSSPSPLPRARFESAREKYSGACDISRFCRAQKKPCQADFRSNLSSSEHEKTHYTHTSEITILVLGQFPLSSP